MFLSYEIIILTETWLTSDITDAELGFDSFKIFRLDRNPNISPHAQGGGVLIAIKSSLILFPVTLSHPDVEQVFAIISLNSTLLLIGSTYLPHSSSLSVIESHLTTVENLLTSLKPN